MMTVDNYMNRNLEKGFHGFNKENLFPTKASRFHIPAITMDEAFDLFGENDEDYIPTVFLPHNGYDQEKLNVRQYMASHPLAVHVVYECPHEGEKVRHHFDYSKPLEVEKLCKKCHAKAHSEINRKEKHTLILMIAIKMLFIKLALVPVHPAARIEPKGDDDLRSWDSSNPSLDLSTGLDEEDRTPFRDSIDPSCPTCPSLELAPRTVIAVDTWA